MPLNNKQSSLKKFFKWLGVIIGILLLLVIGSQVFLYYYFQKNKKEIEAKISALLADEINGNIDFDNLDIVLYKSFPDATIGLQHLTISDSLYEQHKINAVEIENLFLRVNALSLISGQTKIETAVLSNGKIHLFVDSSEYSNLNIFKSKEEKKKDKEIILKQFELDNIQCVFADAIKNKKHDVTFKSLRGSMEDEGTNTILQTKIDAKVAKLGFNLAKGSFLVGDKVTGDVTFIINSAEKSLTIKKTDVMVNKEKISVEGVFTKVPNDVAFKLNFKSDNANFGNIRSSLTDFLSNRLSLVDVEKELPIEAYLQGHLAYPDTPTVRILCTTKDNKLTTDFGTFSHATFNFEYFNYVKDGHGHSDSNSMVMIQNFRGEFEGIPFQSKKFRLDNLINPYARGVITANFDASKLAPLTAGTFNFSKGQVAVDVRYSGPLKVDDNRSRSLDGEVSLSNADLTYSPRNLDFKNCKATLLFDKDDLYFKNVEVHRVNDKISMSGSAKQFMNFYFKDPTKVHLNFTVSANQFTVANYIGFMNKNRRARVSQSNASKLARVNKNLANFTDASTMHLDLDLKNISYKSFVSSRGRADISLLPNAIAINTANIQFRDGAINANGKIETSKANKDFNVNADLQNVDIGQLLAAFNNFGQPTLNPRNILGKINMDATLKGILNKNAALVQNSLEGNVQFNVQRGFLKDFEPLEKLEKYALNTRDLSNLEIRKLDGNFKVKNGLVYIPPTQINTSALTLFLQGVYGIRDGTLISMMIPLRNPKKDELKKAKGKEVDKTKGIKLYLEARDGEDGKVNISWQSKEDRPNYTD